MSDPFDRRLRDCRRRLEAADADAVVCFPSPNLAYLTGFEESPSERHLLLVVPRAGEPVFVAPTMYADQLAGTPIEDVRLWDDGDDPVALLESALSDLEIRDGRVLVDDRMWALFTQDLRRLLPDATFDLASVVFEALRLRKDEVELEALRRAGTLADRVSLELRARGEALVGTTEADLADEIVRLLGDHGGGKPSFAPIVASGPNGARPHHHSGDREIRPGDPVVLDFGAYVDADLASGTARYPGDQTRTIVFDGEPPATYREIHGIVEEAQAAAVDAVEPGVTAGSIDRAARSVIEEAGYGDAFVHRTGHGVGLEVHEPPYIVGGNDRELEPGMVFSIEPGIYLEGKYGVRIEDLVVVTEDGVERLNDSPRGWEASV